jgi:hypothetical protein
LRSCARQKVVYWWPSFAVNLCPQGLRSKSREGWHDAIVRQALFTTLRGNASFYKWRAKYGGMPSR